MPQYVSERTKTARDAPQERRIKLIIRVDSEDVELAADWVQNHGGELELEREYGLLQFLLPEPAVADLCELDYVDSVDSPDEAIEVLDGGN